jgi:hypothetical protein
LLFGVWLNTLLIYQPGISLRNDGKEPTRPKSLRHACLALACVATVVAALYTRREARGYDGFGQQEGMEIYWILMECFLLTIWLLFREAGAYLLAFQAETRYVTVRQYYKRFALTLALLSFPALELATPTF